MKLVNRDLIVNTYLPSPSGPCKRIRSSVVNSRVRDQTRFSKQWGCKIDVNYVVCNTKSDNNRLFIHICSSKQVIVRVH